MTCPSNMNMPEICPYVRIKHHKHRGMFPACSCSRGMSCFNKTLLRHAPLSKTGALAFLVLPLLQYAVQLMTRGACRWCAVQTQAEIIITCTENHKHTLKALILNLPDANHPAYESVMTIEPRPVYCLQADAYPEMAQPRSQNELTHRIS